MFGFDSLIQSGVDLFQSERAIDRDADAADTAWRRGQENMGISNAFAASEAQKARDFNERMANTSHQREVNDLRAAGLNPILSRNAGAPAAGPSAAAASAGVSQQSAANTGKGLASAMALERMKIENANTEEDTGLKHEDKLLRKMDWNVRLADQRLRLQQEQTEQENTRAAKATADILTSDAKGRAHEGDIEDAAGGIPASVLRWINRISESLQGASSAKRRATVK